MISLLKTKVVLLHFFLLPSEFKHMRPEVSDPIVQRFRGSEVQMFRGSEVQRFSSDILYVRTYVSPQTCVRTRTDLPFECAQQWAQTSRPSASASALPSFPVFVLRVFIFIFIFNFIHLGLVCLLRLCWVLRYEVRSARDRLGLVRDPVSSMCLLMTEIADRGSDERPG